MSSKIIEITEKIYREGVEKAQSEATNMLNKAKAEAAEIIEEAKKQAAKIIEDANKKAEETDNGIREELSNVAEQVLTDLKSSVLNSISGQFASEITSDTLNNKELVGDIIIALIKELNADSAEAIDVQTEEKLTKDVEQYINAKSADVLKGDINISTNSNITSGFTLVCKDKGFKLSFTDKDFEAYFQSFMKPKIKGFLFK
jgi:V/A-type H+-transporting ATPase subunit E